MRYLSAFLYGLAAFTGTSAFWNSLAIGLCVAIATIALAFAVEGMIRHELWRAAQEHQTPTRRREKRRPF